MEKIHADDKSSLKIANILNVDRVGYCQINRGGHSIETILNIYVP